MTATTSPEHEIDPEQSETQPFWERSGENAVAYDIETAHYTQDIPYWESVLDQHRPQRVLELACGTGRLTVPLAVKGRRLRRDFQITGLDKSRPFLTSAQDKIERLEPEVAEGVSFIEGDMRQFDLDQQFDLILVGYGSLMVLLEIEDQLACLRMVRRHLSSNGRFAFDLAMPPFRKLADAHWPISAPLRLIIDNPANLANRTGRFFQYLAEQYFPHNQNVWRHAINEIDFPDGHHERITEAMWLHMYFPREVQLLLRLSGLRIVEQYGSYDRGMFNQASSVMLWTMVKDDDASLL